MSVSITLKNVPELVYARLKAMAEENRRSLNSQAIVCLEQALQQSVTDALGVATAPGKAEVPSTEALLERLRRYRGRLPAGYRFDREEANEREPLAAREPSAPRSGPR